MSQHRKHRGLRTQKVVAEWFKARGWPFAESAGAGRSGADITGMLDCAVEVKARRDFNPLAWIRQARSGAAGRLPFVVMRANGQGETSVGEWPVLIRLDDFTRLLHEAGYGDPDAVAATGTPPGARRSAEQDQSAPQATPDADSRLVPIDEYLDELARQVAAIRKQA